jgi:hypothetical protein
VGWNGEDTVPAQVSRVTQNGSRRDGILRWHELLPIVLAASLLLMILGAGHIFATSQSGAGPRIGEVPTISAPSAGEETPAVTVPSTTAPPPTGLLAANRVTTKARREGKHHDDKPDSDHSSVNHQAHHHGDNPATEHHGDRMEPYHHGNGSEAYYHGDRSQRRSHHHHSQAQSI